MYVFSEYITRVCFKIRQHSQFKESKIQALLMTPFITKWSIDA